MAVVNVNGKALQANVDPRTPLLWVLRDTLGLTGTHVGCDTSQCGACVVHVDGIAAKSCTLLALQCEGAKVTTIEGLAEPNGPLHPMQEAFRENHGLQCVEPRIHPGPLMHIALERSVHAQRAQVPR